MAGHDQVLVSTACCGLLGRLTEVREDGNREKVVNRGGKGNTREADSNENMHERRRKR